MGEPRSWGEFTAELVKLIGQEADTGGSSTEGTVFAKENAILEILRNGGMPIVKSVQYGMGSTRYEGGATVISISPINKDRAVVILNGSGAASNAAPVLSFIDTETIGVYGSQSSSVVMFSWQVIEFF